MADPVGIVGLGITVLHGLITYYRNLKDQDDDIVSLNTQLLRLHKIFTDIESRIEETKNTLPLVKRRNIESALEECVTEVEELDKKLKAIQTLDPPKGSRAKMKARFKRLRYPFDGKRTVFEIKEIASGLNGHIVAVTNVLQM
ncbi:hypothetical protein EX30DRAFT_50294 [Ascodesmis nigricans]|uniref:Fungal N-terminal domain-containing protein n=1 Tax=Ascodesmis nigricans TaxID=341454 RepID=A0A4S2MVU8_9PEZI|nr:hypothetical protein EX30DRAFT_50294 [Ascodesmis nigricans]